MSLLYQKHASRPLTLDNRVEPELYRDVFPYTHVSRIEFDDTFLVPRPADPMFITDTTFRDGQQARPPYTVKQIARIYDLLHPRRAMMTSSPCRMEFGEWSVGFP